MTLRLAAGVVMLLTAAALALYTHDHLLRYFAIFMCLVAVGLITLVQRDNNGKRMGRRRP